MWPDGDVATGQYGSTMDEQLYRVILGTLPHTLLVLDRQLHIVLCNRSCAGLMAQWAHAEGDPQPSPFLTHPDLQRQARAVLQHGGTKLVELYLNSTTGSPTVLRAVLTALPTARRDNPFCLLLLEDISARVQLEEQLVESEKLAAMGILAQSMAHELGNPLSVMTATLQYVRARLEQTGSPPLTEAIDTLMDSVNQLHALLLDLSGFTGTHRPRFEATDLRRAPARVSGRRPRHQATAAQPLEERHRGHAGRGPALGHAGAGAKSGARERGGDPHRDYRYRHRDERQ